MAGAVLGSFSGAVIGGGLFLLLAMGTAGALIRPWWGVGVAAAVYAMAAMAFMRVPISMTGYDFAAALLVGFIAWGIAGRLRRRRPEFIAIR